MADWGNNRVQVYEPDGETLAALYGGVFELSSAGLYQLNRDPESVKILNRSEDVMPVLEAFQRPMGIVIDGQDRVVVTDARGRLLVYRKDKEYVEPPI